MSAILIVVCFVVAWIAKQIVGTLLAQQVKGSIVDYTTAKAVAAARQLSSALAEEYEEAWLAELGELEHKPISALLFAVGLSRAARAIAVLAGESVAPSRQTLALSRVIDVASSALLIAFLAPLLGAISLAVWIQNPKQPVIYRRMRVGKDGRPFVQLRFVTISLQPDGDYRIPPFGTMLETTGLNALPMLFNVLRGDMAIIGPPPRLVDEHPALTSVRPGMLSWERLVVYGYVDLTIDEAEDRDQSPSFAKDVELVLRSVYYYSTLKS
jgi:hypothetical protein